MSRTDQAHQWVIYFVLVLFSVTVCYAFVAGQLSVEAFVGMASTVLMFFFNRPKPGDGNANGGQSSTVVQPARPPTP